MKIGFSKKVITPAVFYEMAGYDRRKEKAVGVHDDLYASCIALISDAGERIAFCVLDVLGTDRELSEMVSNAVAADGVWVSATHTHAAPRAVFVGRETSDPTYHVFVTEQCRIAAEEAFASAREAAVSRAVTSVRGIASVRNVLRGASSYEMPLLALKFDTGAKPVLLTRFQCHPTVLNEQNLLYSCDFVNGARVRLPEQTLFMNGACGDLSTRYTRKAATFEEADRIGSILADAVSAAPFTVDSMFGKTAAIRKRTVSIRRAASVDGEEKERLTRYFSERSVNCPDENEKREYDSILCVLNGKHMPAENDRQVTLTVADFGSMALAGLPFEVRHDDALVIEHELSGSAGKPVFVAAYTGGYESYLASGEPISEKSTYEDFESRYLPETRERILNTLKEMVG